MARKRKVVVPEVVPEAAPVKKITELHTIVQCTQKSETFHNKYLKDLQNVYAKYKHEEFVKIFTGILSSAMQRDETHEFANTALSFCAKFITSFAEVDDEETHPMMTSIFNWLLSNTSPNQHIRFRLCQFVNLILKNLGQEAALDDNICDSILKYMLLHLKDQSASVRVEAIHALQRIQNPENPDDQVVKTYTFHLSSDPSPKVRQAVISSIGRNYNTIPMIIDRLWDIDEKVRRHAYLQMSSYPVKAYKVIHRLNLLEQGLSDHSESVKKIVTNIMLPNWLESYNKKYLDFVSALKLDASDTEIERFRKTAKMALKEIFQFKNHKLEDFIAALPFERSSTLTDNEDEMELIQSNLDIQSPYTKCIPHEKLDLESTIFWLSLVEYLNEHDSDDIEKVLPELSTFCDYIRKYFEADNSTMDKWEKMEFQYILFSLLEILSQYDLGDEIGRETMKTMLCDLFMNCDLEEMSIKLISSCFEVLILDHDGRIQHNTKLIRQLLDPSTKIDLSTSLVEEILSNQSNKDLEFKLSSIKVKIMDLEEQESISLQNKEYAAVQKLDELLILAREEYANCLKPFMSNDALKKIGTKITEETVLKCLQLAHFTISSKKVRSLIPEFCELYNDVIRRYIESTHLKIRNWALICSTACGMLYEALAKDVYSALFQQFFRNHHHKVWGVAISCIFELLDKYGFEYFDNDDKTEKNKKGGRQLYNTTEYLEQDESSDTLETNAKQTTTELMYLMSKFLEDCEDPTILRNLIEGFCRLVLRGHYTSTRLVGKLLVRYFSPTTEVETNQLLGIFFESLMKKKKQECLQSALLPSLFIILEAPYDSPLKEIKTETVLKFVIDSTRTAFCSPGLNIHNTIAMSFLEVMETNILNKELLRLLSKELITLEIADDPHLRNDLKACVERLLAIETDPKIEPKTEKNILSFKAVLSGTYQEPLQFSSSRVTGDDNNDENEQNPSDDENVTEETEIEVEKENEPTPIATNAEPILPQAPTTFGVTNKSNMRSLRKSISVSVDSESMPPPKALPRATRKKTNRRGEILVPETQQQTEEIDDLPEIEIPGSPEISRVESEEEEVINSSQESLENKTDSPKPSSDEEDEEVIPSSQEPEPTPKEPVAPRGRRPNRKNADLEESIPASPEVVAQTSRSRIRSRRNFSDSPPAQQVKKAKLTKEKSPVKQVPAKIAPRKKKNPSITMEKMPQAIVSPSTTPRTRGAAIEKFQETVNVTSPRNTRKTVLSEKIDENPKTPKSVGRPKKVQTPSQPAVNSPNIMSNRTSSRNSQTAPSTPKTSTVNSPRVSRSNQGTPKAAEKTSKSTESLKSPTPKVTRTSIAQDSPTTSIRSSSRSASTNTPKRGKNTEPEVETIKTPIRKKQIENEKTPKTSERIRRNVESKSPESPRSNLRRSRSTAGSQNTPKRGKNSEPEIESVKTTKLPGKGNDNLRNTRKNETAQKTSKEATASTAAVTSSPKENVRPSRTTTKVVAVLGSRSSRSMSNISSGSSTRITRKNVRQMASTKK